MIKMLKNCFKKLPKMVGKSSQLGSKIEEIGARGYPKEATRSENYKKNVVVPNSPVLF